MTFSINIHEARHGWLYMELRLQAQQFELMASDVLNDPVQELAELALFITSAEAGTRVVNFWLEPQGYELCATANRELELKMSYSDEAYPGLRKPSLVAVAVVDRTAVAREILRCLRAAQPLFTAAASADPRTWNQPFPETTVAKLETTLA
jgi:hypothetical protein